MTSSKVKAPDVSVMLADGSRLQLSALWQNTTLVLVFLRHLG
ncbi:MAG: hypothetical protein QNJ61_08825 [Desulfobacterales bacterium]|nr:hypothetical protein [Desulfobacterales bacterium]